jgi:deazaflavin-dependent oxidoreductase (nitroreductase family)
MARVGLWGRLTSTFKPPTADSRLWAVERAVTNLHVWIFQRTNGRVLGAFDGAPLLILHHRGARTGLPRRTPMIYLPDGENLVVVASMGGQPKHPAWYHNLRAHPDVEADVRGGRRALRARRATDAEAAALWPRLSAMWPAWDVYKTRTARTFPVVICEPR